MSKETMEIPLDSDVIENIIDSRGTFAEKAEVPFTYSKKQFLKSEEYKRHKDLLNVLLADNKFYGKSEVNKMLDDYLKGKVK